MKVRPANTLALALVAVLLLPSPGSAQWLTEPTPGIPRTADGRPNLSAPAPRTSDGKPDLSGLWHAGAKYVSDFKTSDAQPWAQAQARQREANPAADSWATLCLPPGPMITFTGPLKIIQTPLLVTALYEVPNNFRQIFTDGRSLPKDPKPYVAGVLSRALGRRYVGGRDDRVQRQIVGWAPGLSPHRRVANHGAVSTTRLRAHRPSNDGR